MDEKAAGARGRPGSRPGRDSAFPDRRLSHFRDLEQPRRRRPWRPRRRPVHFHSRPRLFRRRRFRRRRRLVRRRRRIGGMVMRELADEAAIVAAVGAAETRTSGQIVCVLARRSCDAGFSATLWAAALALLTPWPLLAFTQMSAQHIFAVQAGLFVVALLLLNWTGCGLALTPRGQQRRQAFRAAA